MADAQMTRAVTGASAWDLNTLLMPTGWDADTAAAPIARTSAMIERQGLVCFFTVMATWLAISRGLWSCRSTGGSPPRSRRTLICSLRYRGHARGPGGPCGLRGHYAPAYLNPNGLPTGRNGSARMPLITPAA